MSTDPSDRSPRPRSANRQRPSSHDHIGERLRADASAPSRDRSKQKLESRGRCGDEAGEPGFQVSSSGSSPYSRVSTRVPSWPVMC